MEPMYLSSRPLPNELILLILDKVSLPSYKWILVSRYWMWYIEDRYNRLQKKNATLVCTIIKEIKHRKISSDVITFQRDKPLQFSIHVIEYTNIHKRTIYILLQNGEIINCASFILSKNQVVNLDANQILVKRYLSDYILNYKYINIDLNEYYYHMNNSGKYHLTCSYPQKCTSCFSIHSIIANLQDILNIITIEKNNTIARWKYSV